MHTAKKLARDGRRRDLFAALIEQGWILDLTKKNHIRARSPAGAVVYLSGTPSSRRTVDEDISVLRRHGFVRAARTQ